jgi:queuine tRNA-ribosyltransferase
MPALTFTIDATDSATRARAGTLVLPHGIVRTPVFMPVGTQATVKGVLPRDLAEAGAKIILANTYHLLLRPGPDLVAASGGLHNFMRWDGPILTDSGGFQAFSLARAEAGERRAAGGPGGARISEEGVIFRSHLDGAEIRLTPERALEIQEALGADIVMQLDECPKNPCSREVARAAVERTVAWAKRSRAAKRREDQALFGIEQGSLFSDLRRECAERLAELDLPGYAIGGLAVGEAREEMLATLAGAAAALPAEKPRYLMGVGTPLDILDAMACGVDMFDCVMPTRNARNSSVFTDSGRLNLRNACYRNDFRTIEAGCDCHACRERFSRAYLRHLFLAKEMLAATLATIHNLRFYIRLAERARAAIAAGRFASFRAEFAASYGRAADAEEEADPGR